MADYQVLIVDDQPDVRQVLRAGIESLEFDIDVVDVPSGEEAILVLSRQPIDLLVADIRLPGISGLELKDQTLSRNPEMKFILITGLTSKKVRNQAANAGAEGFFIKPVKIDDFLDTVRSALGLCPEGEIEQGDVEVSDEEPESLSGRLLRLYRDLGALAVLLIGDRGEVLEQAGGLTPEAISPVLISPLMTFSIAARKASYHLGMDVPENLLILRGKEFDLFMTHVSSDMELLLAMPIGYFNDERMLDLVPLLRSGVSDLLVILDQMGVSQKTQADVQKLDMSGVEGDDEEDVHKFEVAIKKGKKKLKSEDADAFWDSLEGDSVKDVARGDAISYDQARKLGLTPDD
jgi:CheY-like chemotaxis protein